MGQFKGSGARRAITLLNCVIAGLEQSVRPVRQVPDHFLGNSIPQFIIFEFRKR